MSEKLNFTFLPILMTAVFILSCFFIIYLFIASLKYIYISVFTRHYTTYKWRNKKQIKLHFLVYSPIKYSSIHLWIVQKFYSLNTEMYSSLNIRNVQVLNQGFPNCFVTLNEWTYSLWIKLFTWKTLIFEVMLTFQIVLNFYVSVHLSIQLFIFLWLLYFNDSFIHFYLIQHFYYNWMKLLQFLQEPLGVCKPKFRNIC